MARAGRSSAWCPCGSSPRRRSRVCLGRVPPRRRPGPLLCVAWCAPLFPGARCCSARGLRCRSAAASTSCRRLFGAHSFRGRAAPLPLDLSVASCGRGFACCWGTSAAWASGSRDGGKWLWGDPPPRCGLLARIVPVCGLGCKARLLALSAPSWDPFFSPPPASALRAIEGRETGPPPARGRARARPGQSRARRSARRKGGVRPRGSGGDCISAPVLTASRGVRTPRNGGGALAFFAADFAANPRPQRLSEQRGRQKAARSADLLRPGFCGPRPKRAGRRTPGRNGHARDRAGASSRRGLFSARLAARRRKRTG